MRPDRDIERVLDSYFESVPSTVPERFYDAVLDQVERTPQRRALHPTKLRYQPMNAFRLLAAALLAAALGLGAAGILGSRNDGPAPSPSPSASSPCQAVICPAGTLTQARSAHRAVLLPDGRVLVVGGDVNYSHQLETAEIWDPATLTFSPLAGSMAGGRSKHTLTRLTDGRILVVGGQDPADGTKLGPAELWDPASETFSPTDSLLEPRGQHTATLLPDGRVLIVGGFSTDGPLNRDTAEIWDPATETFGSTGSLAERRGGHTATLLPGGRVLVIGGWGGQAEDADRTLAELWEPATGRWRPAGEMAVGRTSHTATLLRDGRILVVGGDTEDNRSTAEFWDPATETFSPTGSPANPRTFSTATLLPDGRVLVVGGQNASIEAWESRETGTFSPAGSLPEARGAHTATLLDDGRVLIVGGGEYGGTDLSSAYLYDPEGVMPLASPLTTAAP